MFPVSWFQFRWWLAPVVEGVDGGIRWPKLLLFNRIYGNSHVFIVPPHFQYQKENHFLTNAMRRYPYICNSMWKHLWLVASHIIFGSEYWDKQVRRGSHIVSIYSWWSKIFIFHRTVLVALSMSYTVVRCLSIITGLKTLYIIVGD